MKSNKLVINIDRPVKEVFAFTTDPKNTPKWIDFITTEETNEWPPRLGTIYRNRNGRGPWKEYLITAFDKDKMFIMSPKKSDYNVRYTFMPAAKDSTKLEYYEWADEGELEEPFTVEILEKLKLAVESK